jgi:serine protease inhibitor
VPAVPLAGNQAVARVAAACNGLSFSLVRLLGEASPHQNVFISSTSLALALLMLHSGAGGDTRREIAAPLGVKDLDKKGATRLGASLSRLLQVSDPLTRLAAANGVWVNRDVCLSSRFVQAVAKVYAGTAGSVDFSDPRTVEAINQWASLSTAGQIESVVTADDLATSTDCVLASAVSFKGAWRIPFDPELTTRQTFTLPNGAGKVVPFMSRTGQCLYWADEAIQAVSLPYAGDRLSMEVFLPAAGGTPAELVAMLDPARWDNILAGFELSELRVELPRFRLTYAADMRIPLSALGIRLAFGPGADFSPMGLGGHFIGMFKHATQIDVSEEGTEAAATTAAVLIRSARRPASLRVDRPFFCAIRDHSTGCLLFAGIVAEPS